MAENFLPLSRELRKHWLYKQKPFCEFAAWVDLLFLARYSMKPETEKCKKGGFVTVERGQIWRTYEFFRESWGWTSTKKVRTFLKNLKQDNMITIETDQKGAHITIVNYEFYNSSGHAEGTHGAGMGQVAGTHGAGMGQRKNKGVIKEKDSNIENIEITNTVSAKPKRTRKRKIDSEYSEKFEKFWFEFPRERRGSKEKAFKIWEEYGFDLEKNNHHFENVLNDVIHKRRTNSKFAGEYAPKVTTYLNEKRWETKLPEDINLPPQLHSDRAINNMKSIEAARQIIASKKQG